MRLYPFRAWRPAPGRERRVASPPYDVVDAAGARAIADGHPDCFLRVTRPDLELPDGAPPDAPACYALAAERFRGLQASGALARDPAPALYLYRLVRNSRAQTGVVGLFSAADYDAGVIRRHEHTRPAPEQDRLNHIAATGAQTGPVFLAHREAAGLAALRAAAVTEPPLFDFEADDGVRHTGWRIADPAPWIAAFAALPAAYIADGHHRAAAACRLAREGAGGAIPGFLAVAFPARELTILAYHRVVRDLHGRTPAGLLDALRGAGFSIEPSAQPEPESAGRAGLFLDGRWWRLGWTIPEGGDPVARLDAAVLQTRVLGPLLGVEDPRRSDRIAFIGGIHGAAALEERVHSGAAAAAFALHPASMDDLMTVADAGLVMPPKSTWFEPKLRDGLFVHTLED
jgi:uncharacterized protein (DUF1015 family)